MCCAPHKISYFIKVFKLEFDGDIESLAFYVANGLKIVNKEVSAVLTPVISSEILHVFICLDGYYRIQMMRQANATSD
jgi:hypothetical protein